MKSTKHTYIYLTTNNINGKIYVGQSSCLISPEKHRYLGSGLNLLKSIEKYGKGNFTKSILEVLPESSTQEELDTREKYWIKHYNSTNQEIGYNLALGGQGQYKVNSTTTKEKMSASKKGVRFSDKHRESLSESHKGKKLPLEVRQKMTLSRTGKTWKWDENKRLNYRSTLKGRKLTEEHKEKISQGLKRKSEC